MILVCQISRGLAPAESVSGAAWHAAWHGCRYRAIVGLPAVAAKNAAVDAALAIHAHLLLLEDDVISEPALWAALHAIPHDVVAVAPTLNRDGSENTHYDQRGQVLFSGSCFLFIPHLVLNRLMLDGPIFQALDHTIINDELVAVGPNYTGKGSDVHFWYRLRRLEPRPTVVVLPRVKWIRHALNMEHNLQNPCVLEVVG